MKPVSWQRYRPINGSEFDSSELEALIAAFDEAAEQDDAALDEPFLTDFDAGDEPA